MNIGLIAISAKPYHAGHHSLIQHAAQENDAVILFVSLADRARPGEVVISGRDMARIWKDELTSIMPANVSLVYLTDESPIKRIYKVLGEVDPDTDDRYYVYGDPDDIASNFSEENIQKYLADLYGDGRLQFRTIPREDTVDVSGTQMRQWLEDGNMVEFINHLPLGVNGQAIWQLLRKRLERTILASMIK